jgi:hypothetical protein
MRQNKTILSVSKMKAWKEFENNATQFVDTFLLAIRLYKDSPNLTNV